MSEEQRERFVRLKKERRLKRYVLDEAELVRILNWRLEPAGSYLALTQDDLPSDAIVIHVGYSFTTCGLCAIIGHESFEPVAHGDVVPTPFGARVLQIEKKSYL